MRWITLDRALYQLRQKSGQMFNDYGLWVLWLGVGMLDWREEGAHETSSAPLLLVPVELRRESGRRYRLHPADGQVHAGRSVLFVSEKAAALDVVRNRLRGVGLGDFVLALHSGDTSK